MEKRRKFLKSLALSTLSAGAIVSQSRGASAKKTAAKGMLQRNVYFWLKDGVTDRQRKAVVKGIKKLVNSVKEIRKSEIGVPAPTASRDVVDHTFDFSMFIWFNSIEDHDVYQKHEAHKKFIEDFSSYWAKVRVYDSTLI